MSYSVRSGIRHGARSWNISTSWRTHVGLYAQDRVDSTQVHGDDITPGSLWPSTSQ